MNNKGFRVGLVAALLLLTGYYLWPTASLALFNRSAPAEGTPAYAAWQTANAETLADRKEKALKLGLDLQGGMSSTLEVRVDELIRALASDTDAPFDSVMAVAQREARTSDASFVDLFVDAFEARDGDARLARYFRSDAGGLTRRSSNADVRTYLQAQADDAVNRAIEIVRTRVDRFGVAEPSIVRKGTRRIAIELPGVDDAARIRRLLGGTAQLEFRLMADPDEMGRALNDIVAFYNDSTRSRLTVPTAATAPAAGAADSAAAAPSTLALATGAGRNDSASADSSLDSAAAAASRALATPATGNALLKVLTPIGGVQFGSVAVKDTSVANRLLRRPDVQALLPRGVSLLWDARPTVAPGAAASTGQILLLGVKDKVEITGETVEEASVQFDQQTNAPGVSMTMDDEGGSLWSRLTGANIGKPVAIVLDDYVVSYPTVQGRIPNGRSSITGLGDRNEANDLVNVLRSGSLPAPVQIIEESTVGPSLGAESIRNGALSFGLGFLVVAAFMIFWYRTAGVVSVAALILNVLFIIGILAAFRATLTLPGIAGMVLTLGMAVDANVLIYERIREELDAGKNFRLAVEEGFANALSAILDSNITTFLTGVILYAFGVGPIQGFAVTLMAGILTSLFAALVITRFVFDYVVEEKGGEIAIG